MKQPGKVRGLAMAVLIGTVVVSCGGDGDDAGMGPAGGGDVVLVEVTGATTVGVGSTLQLTATAKNATGGTVSGRAVTWTSASTAKATVDNSGLVTALTPGPVTITATVDGVPGGLTITIT